MHFILNQRILSFYSLSTQAALSILKGLADSRKKNLCHDVGCKTSCLQFEFDFLLLNQGSKQNISYIQLLVSSVFYFHFAEMIFIGLFIMITRWTTYGQSTSYPSPRPSANYSPTSAVISASSWAGAASPWSTSSRAGSRSGGG